MKTSYKKIYQITTTAAIAVVLFANFSFAKIASASDITPDNVNYLINQERIYYGLSPLKDDSRLDSAALQKSTDMISRNYFEHYAYGLTPWDFIHNSQYDYSSASENLAMNFDTAEGMVNTWMQSPTHRANILNPNFTDSGIGIVKGASTNGNSDYVVTNMFGRQKPLISRIAVKTVKNIVDLFTFKI